VNEMDYMRSRIANRAALEAIESLAIQEDVDLSIHKLQRAVALLRSALRTELDS
jgi:hypothetical protein